MDSRQDCGLQDLARLLAPLRPARAARARPAPARAGRRLKAPAPPSPSPSARIVAVLAGWPSAVAPLAEVLAAAGIAPAEASGLLQHLEGRGEIDCWPEPDGDRIMLGTSALARLGLVLDARGRRWLAAKP